jgi:transposase-like protein
MAYSVDVKEKAFQLYVQGASFDEIVEETNVNKKTLLRWKRHEGWVPRKEKILEDMQKKNDEKQVELLADLLAKTTELLKQTYREIKEVGSFRTMEGGVAAYIQLTNMILRLQPQKKEMKIDKVLGKVLKVLFDHPKIGLVMDKYKEDIIERINKELGDED